jgi:DNA invertase Pin-like site-specific DNA recombinase
VTTQTDELGILSRVHDRNFWVIIRIRDYINCGGLARQRKFDVVAGWKLDRFGRSLRDLVNSLDEFRSLGIEFASLTEAIDFGSSLGAVMFALIGAMAEFERNLIKERVAMGIGQGAQAGAPPWQATGRSESALRHCAAG